MRNDDDLFWWLPDEIEIGEPRVIDDEYIQRLAQETSDERNHTETT